MNEKLIEFLRRAVGRPGGIDAVDSDSGGRLTVRGFSGGTTRAETISREDFTCEAMVSTNALDRYDTIIEPDGWELDNFRKNPVVFWGHEDWKFPIARSLEERKLSDGLWAKPLFAASLGDAAPAVAKEAWALHSGDFIRAWSVSFWPLEWEEFQTKDGTGETIRGYRLIRNELLEYSLVGIPGNPNTLTLGLARAAIEGAARHGMSVPDSALPGNAGIVSRAARVLAASEDLREDVKSRERIDALTKSVRRLSLQPEGGPAESAMAQVLANMTRVGTELKALL